MFKSKQAGFTLIELVTVIASVGALTLIGGIIYVAGHFIAKFW